MLKFIPFPDISVDNTTVFCSNNVFDKFFSFFSPIIFISLYFGNFIFILSYISSQCSTVSHNIKTPLPELISLLVILNIFSIQES